MLIVLVVRVDDAAVGGGVVLEIGVELRREIDDEQSQVLALTKRYLLGEPLQQTLDRNAVVADGTLCGCEIIYTSCNSAYKIIAQTNVDCLPHLYD